MFLKESDDIGLEALLIETGSFLRETVKVGEGLHNLSCYGTFGLLVSGCNECVILLEVNLEATRINPVEVGEGIVNVA